MPRQIFTDGIDDTAVRALVAHGVVRTYPTLRALRDDLIAPVQRVRGLDV